MKIPLLEKRGNWALKGTGFWGPKGDGGRFEDKLPLTNKGRKRRQNFAESQPLNQQKKKKIEDKRRGGEKGLAKSRSWVQTSGGKKGPCRRGRGKGKRVQCDFPLREKPLQKTVQKQGRKKTAG